MSNTPQTETGGPEQADPHCDCYKCEAGGCSCNFCKAKRGID